MYPYLIMRLPCAQQIERPRRERAMDAERETQGREFYATMWNRHWEGLPLSRGQIAMADKRVRKAVTAPRLLLLRRPIYICGTAAKTRADTLLRSFYDLSTPILGNTHLGSSDLMVKLTTTKRSQMTFKMEREKWYIFILILSAARHNLSNWLEAVCPWIKIKGEQWLKVKLQKTCDWRMSFLNLFLQKFCTFSEEILKIWQK